MQCYSTEITCPRSLVYKCLNWDHTAVYNDGKITLKTIQVFGEDIFHFCTETVLFFDGPKAYFDCCLPIQSN